MGRARDIRLLSDYQKITGFAAMYPFLTITHIEGMPPVAYHLLFKLRGYLNVAAQIAEEHEVKLSFPEQYPFSAPPKFAFVKGLFHPNVYKNGDVCHGWYLNNWHPGIHIDDLLLDITKMICFKPDSYNLKSPANYACDADWIAAHTIPADDINLHTVGLVPSADTVHPIAETPPATSDENQPKTEEVKSAEVKIKIKSIRNVLTFSETAQHLPEPPDNNSNLQQKNN
ncbi:hypothetical protein C7N43_21485 [Sphingobacteriales bacterium UPWRP_1]|nr:hypothetical protein B6N25_09680 [Sphingobacteriales bacterium TSM_CSS]PSJ74937.1 hypothetical protein C7N43_21485 [Sphingobacteriales bacterium UPWRP_1]